MKEINFQNYSISGIMFHHFHDDKLFLNSQGSINAYQFQSIINFVKKKVQILSPYDFKKNLKNRKPEKATCITFDDGLLSQYKIAKPVSDSLNIKLSFVYSAIWDENFETPCLSFLETLDITLREELKLL